MRDVAEGNGERVRDPRQKDRHGLQQYHGWITYIADPMHGVNRRLMMQIVHGTSADVIKQLHTFTHIHTMIISSWLR